MTFAFIDPFGASDLPVALSTPLLDIPRCEVLDQGLRKMKDAMWKVDPVAGASFRDSTLADHPVLFQESTAFDELERMLREHFGDGWFAIKDAERFALLETPFRDNAHLKRPTLKPAEDRGALEVERRSGQRTGTFSPRYQDALQSQIRESRPPAVAVGRILCEHMFDAPTASDGSRAAGQGG